MGSCPRIEKAGDSVATLVNRDGMYPRMSVVHSARFWSHKHADGRHVCFSEENKLSFGRQYQWTEREVDPYGWSQQRRQLLKVRIVRHILD